MQKTRIIPMLLVIALLSTPGPGQNRKRANRRASRRAQQRSQQKHQDSQKATKPSSSAQSQGTVLKLSIPPIPIEKPLCLWLPDNEKQADDALPYYQKAIGYTSGHADKRILSTWFRMEPEQLPIQDVESLLKNCKRGLEQLLQANTCRNCNWPATSPTAKVSLNGYRDLARLLAVKARYHISQAQFMEGIKTFKTGFSLAHNLNQGPTLMHGMVGVAVSSLMCQQIESFIQQKQAPSLHAAISSLPQPFVSLETQMQAEIDNLNNHPQVNALNKGVFKKQLHEAHQPVRLLILRFNRHLAALQTIEALRLYAARHNGPLPQRLGQIQDITVPMDPITNKPFIYKAGSGGATLSGPLPEGGREKDALSYELRIQ